MSYFSHRLIIKHHSLIIIIKYSIISFFFLIYSMLVDAQGLDCFIVIYIRCKVFLWTISSYMYLETSKLALVSQIQ